MSPVENVCVKRGLPSAFPTHCIGTSTNTSLTRAHSSGVDVFINTTVIGCAVVASSLLPTSHSALDITHRHTRTHVEQRYKRGAHLGLQNPPHINGATNYCAKLYLMQEIITGQNIFFVLPRVRVCDSVHLVSRPRGVIAIVSPQVRQPVTRYFHAVSRELARREWRRRWGGYYWKSIDVT